MEKWNYRLVHRTIESNGHKERSYEIREVSYDDDGLPNAVTRPPSTPTAKSIEELRKVLAQMLIATYEPLFKVSEVTKRHD